MRLLTVPIPVGCRSGVCVRREPTSPATRTGPISGQGRRMADAQYEFSAYSAQPPTVRSSALVRPGGASDADLRTAPSSASTAAARARRLAPSDPLLAR